MPLTNFENFGCLAHVDVSTGMVEVTCAPVILTANGIGSCIVVAGYNIIAKAGALAHIMLPGKSPEEGGLKTRYAVDALDELQARIELLGCRTCDFAFCLAGGANVLRRANDTICQANIDSVSELMSERRLPILAKSLGGTKRRRIVIDLTQGNISCAEGDDPLRLMWSCRIAEVRAI